MPRCFLAAKLKYPYVQWKEEQGEVDRKEMVRDIVDDEDEEIDVENDDIEDTNILKFNTENRINVHYYPQDENMNITSLVKKEIFTENLQEDIAKSDKYYDENISAVTNISEHCTKEDIHNQTIHRNSIKRDYSEDYLHRISSRNELSEDTEQRLSPKEDTNEDREAIEDRVSTSERVSTEAIEDTENEPTTNYMNGYREKGVKHGLDIDLELLHRV